MGGWEGSETELRGGLAGGLGEVDGEGKSEFRGKADGGHIRLLLHRSLVSSI
jgi:hypothetical protein